jgi:hypothetical protein
VLTIGMNRLARLVRLQMSLPHPFVALAAFIAAFGRLAGIDPGALADPAPPEQI